MSGQVYPSCSSGGTPSFGDDDAYCIVPHGNVNMDICCSQIGNSSVHFLPDCYSWCDLEAAKADDDAALAKVFTKCLAGDNGTYASPGTVCYVPTSSSNANSPSGSSTTTSASQTSQTGAASPKPAGGAAVRMATPRGLWKTGLLVGLLVVPAALMAIA